MKRQFRKVDKLPTDYKDSVKILHNQYLHEVSKIEERVKYILDTIAASFGTQLEWWDWANGSSTAEINGHFEPDMIETIRVCVEGSFFDNVSEKIALLKNGKGWREWNFSYLEFPTRFLFEDFEAELENGIKRYKNRKIDQKALRKKDKQEKSTKKADLLAGIKEKLTKERCSN